MASNEAALLIKLIADKSGLDITLKDAEGKVVDFQKKVEQGTSAGIGKFGNMLIKGLGIGLVIRQLQEIVMGIEEVDGATRKIKAQATDMFERTIKPGVPYIVEGIKYISIGLRGLVGALDIVGTFIGSIIGLVVNSFGKIGEAIKRLLSRDFKGASDAIGGIKNDVTAFQENMSAGWKRVKKNFEESSKAKIKLSKDELDAVKREAAERDKMLDRQIKYYGDLLKKQQQLAEADRKRRADEAKSLRKEGLDINFNKAQKEYADRFDHLNRLLDAGAISQETYNKQLQDATITYQDATLASNKLSSSISDTLLSATESLSNNMVDILNGMAVNWSEWANNIIMEIERVILKYLILQALTGGTGKVSQGILGSITGAISGLLKSSNPIGGGSPQVGGGSPQVQIITADPSTTVRFINNSFASATPKDQAVLSRNVRRGQLQDKMR